MYNYITKEIASDQVFFHYSLKLLILLQTSVFPVDVGATLSNIMLNESETLAMFTFCSITPTEQKYSQIEKEALSIVC